MSLTPPPPPPPHHHPSSSGCASSSCTPSSPKACTSSSPKTSALQPPRRSRTTGLYPEPRRPPTDGALVDTRSVLADITNDLSVAVARSPTHGDGVVGLGIGVPSNVLGRRWTLRRATTTPAQINVHDPTPPPDSPEPDSLLDDDDSLRRRGPLTRSRTLRRVAQRSPTTPLNENAPTPSPVLPSPLTPLTPLMPFGPGGRRAASAGTTLTRTAPSPLQRQEQRATSPTPSAVPSSPINTANSPTLPVFGQRRVASANVGTGAMRAGRAAMPPLRRRRTAPVTTLADRAGEEDKDAVEAEGEAPGKRKRIERAGLR